MKARLLAILTRAQEYHHLEFHLPILDLFPLAQARNSSSSGKGSGGNSGSGGAVSQLSVQSNPMHILYSNQIRGFFLSYYKQGLLSIRLQRLVR